MMDGFLQKEKGRHRLRMRQWVLKSPARFSILAFAALIGVGTLLLVLPAASTGKGIGLIDALFTATSASCVTGLAVLDTGKTFGSFGQGVILFLIQVGGLGIMTLSTLFLLLAGRRTSLASRLVIKDALTDGKERSLPSLLKDVLLFTVGIEGIGAFLLFIRFLPGRNTLDAGYLALFHAISAFCNAGFSTFSDSLVQFRDDWIVNLTICFLIISGGLGFLVLSELKRKKPVKRRTWERLSLHSKIVLSTTGILVLAGTFLLMSTEWKNTLQGMSLPGKFLAAFFQSVTARTAGFNTLPIGSMANESLFLLILLMFIGASPGSCGGGIKTTSLASLVALGYSRIRGKERTHCFKRTLAEGSTGKAISIVLVSGIVVVIATMTILMSELGEMSHVASRGRFLELLFEVVSAFGTVGLSTGVTAGLSGVGKVVIIMVMFVGRLGPLVIAMAMSREFAPRYYYAEETIMIG
jgi:trk system potassium uptake protein